MFSIEGSLAIIGPKTRNPRTIAMPHCHKPATTS